MLGEGGGSLQALVRCWRARILNLELEMVTEVQPSRLPENPVPTLHPNAPRAAVFEALRLLKETNDDFYAVAERMGISIFKLRGILRANGLRVQPNKALYEERRQEGLAERRQARYEIARESVEAHGGNRAEAAEELEVSYATLMEWMRHGPRLDCLKREVKQRTVDRRKRRRGKCLEKYRRRMVKTHPVCAGVKRLKFLGDVRVEDAAGLDFEELIREYQAGNRKEVLEKVLPYLKKYCQTRAWKFFMEAGELVYPALVALEKAFWGYSVEKSGGDIRGYLAQKMAFGIVDVLREEDEVPRSLRGHATKLKKFMHGFEAEHERFPNDSEVLEALEWDSHLLYLVRAVRRSSIDAEVKSPIGKSRAVIDFIADPVDGMQDLLIHDEYEEVLRWVTPSDRELVRMYYEQHMTMREIGKVLGKSESRICQRMTWIKEEMQRRGGNVGEV